MQRKKYRDLLRERRSLDLLRCRRRDLNKRWFYKAD